MTTPGHEADFTVGFKRHLRAHVISGEAVYLLSERGVTSVKGAHVEALAPLLDGTRDLAELRRDIPPGLTPAEVGAIVMRLVEAGLVALRPPLETEAEASTLAYWEAAGLDPANALRHAQTKRVQVLTVGDVDASTALAAMSAAGLTAAVGPADRVAEDTDLSVVLCDDYLDAPLARVDALHRAAGRPWLLAKPCGTQVWIGPIFDPTEPTACWHCLAHRLQGHRQAETRLQTIVGQRAALARPAVSLPPLTSTALHLIALETAKWVAGLRHDGQRAIWTLDSLDLRGRHHELRARPQCASCGDEGLMREQTRRPIQLVHRPKVSRSGGGHRSMSPDQVLRAYEHLISPVTGVLKEITRNGPEFFNSFRSGPNLALNVRRHFEQMRTALRAENGGKGVTPLHGKVSALCEAIERHSGYFHGDEERIRGSYADLADRAIHPNACMLYDERQYADRANWNASHSSFQYVCDPFDESTVTDWTPVWSLTKQQHRLLPTGLLYFDVPAEHGGAALSADSNGNAAGSSLEDALLQGLLELVERDAVALWWYNRNQAPQVSLDSFQEPWIDELRAVYASLNREVWVLDVSSDVGVPTMVALSRRTDKPCEDIMFGFGAHLDPKVALIRALTEMNQLMPAVAEVSHDGEYGWSDPDALHWWRTATVANQPYLRPDPAAPPRELADYDYLPTTDLYQDISLIQSKLESLGLEVLVLDQTRPDIGLPVVKVIVPGMRGFWARFAPGRLFDVPVRLGRLNRPTDYHELNPTPLFV